MPDDPTRALAATKRYGSLREWLADLPERDAARREPVTDVRCTCPVGNDAIGPHLRGCPNHPEVDRD